VTAWQRDQRARKQLSYINGYGWNVTFEVKANDLQLTSTHSPVSPYKYVFLGRLTDSLKVLLMLWSQLSPVSYVVWSRSLL